MTENEAIKKLNMLDEALNFQRADADESSCALKMAIQALEEIQQYRELGTVEEILKVFNNQRTIIVTQHETLKQYRAIGTVEEFKKSVAKKPIYSDFDENEAGEIIPYKAVCPVCGHEFEFGTWNDEENHHCVCEQKLDWSK